MTSYDVYYMKDFYRTAVVGEGVTVSEIEHTHTYLKTVEGNDLDDVFVMMQGENWSPNGEARPLIRDKGLFHTSMSVGDVIFDKSNNKWYMVSAFGFKELAK